MITLKHNVSYTETSLNHYSLHHFSRHYQNMAPKVGKCMGKSDIDKQASGCYKASILNIYGSIINKLYLIMYFIMLETEIICMQPP